MVTKRLVPVNDPDQLEFTDNRRPRPVAIRLWVPFLYHHVPWWVWDAIVGEEEYQTVDMLREEMERYEDLQS